MNAHNLILKWCEEIDSKTANKHVIHSSRGKHSKTRKEFSLEDEEIKCLKSIGLHKLRDDIEVYIQRKLKEPGMTYKFELCENHPLNTIKYACGICCRNCIEDYHNIPTWKKLSHKEVKYLTSTSVKWIFTNSSSD